MSDMLRLYRAAFSTNVERVALALAYKGLSAESVWIEYGDRSAVERVSGQGLVPVLVDGHAVVHDSMEIIRYLDERHPDPPLYPRDPARRAELLVFVDWFNRVWKRRPNEIAAELERPSADAERIAGLSQEITHALALFEELLHDRDHLMGDFSAADCAVFPFVKYAAGRDKRDDELFHRVLDEHQQLGSGHPRLAAWIERVDARPRA